MKDVIKTITLVCIIILLVLAYLFIPSTVKEGVIESQHTTLTVEDPTIIILRERLESIDFLRRSKLINTELTSEEIIKFTLDNLTENDYHYETIEPVKILCTVNYQVKFSNSTTCQLKVINNSVFNYYQKQYFNIEQELTFPEIKYHGYYCKNDGNNYYCMTENYVNDTINYSVFDTAYEEKDSIILRGYYLRINLSDTKKCLTYFSEEYCNNYHSSEKPSLSDDIIKKEGVYYEHIFKKNDTSYYLESSTLVSKE